MNKKYLSFALIIIAGETIFMLPFLLPRLLRPLMLEVWQLTNTDFGLAFSAYGISAMLSYIIGGQFADKYPPRKLISISLFLTGIAGVFLVLFPTRLTLIGIYFYYGISTILLMWAALIKVTHDFGGDEKRSTSMGILDSGRGLIAALISTIIVSIFSYLTLSGKSQQFSLNIAVTIIIVFTLLIAMAVWFLLSDKISPVKTDKWSFDKAKQLFKNSDIWPLGIIILSSYCGYKNIDNFSIYLVDIKKLSHLEASKFTSIIFWIRPFAALAAGILADRIRVKLNGGRFLVLFVLLLLGALVQLLLALNIFTFINFVLSFLIISSAFFYAVRSVYFSVFGELEIPSTLTGTAVGIVSIVGFLPDVFFGAVTGHLIDTHPGVEGYTYVFYLTAGILFIGAFAAFISFRKIK